MHISIDYDFTLSWNLELVIFNMLWPFYTGKLNFPISDKRGISFTFGWHPEVSTDSSWRELLRMVISCLQNLFSFSACPNGRYGPSCGKICDCGNGARCHPETGSCICTPGWIGKDCRTRMLCYFEQIDGLACHDHVFYLLESIVRLPNWSLWLRMPLLLRLRGDGM